MGVSQTVRVSQGNSVIVRVSQTMTVTVTVTVRMRVSCSTMRVSSSNEMSVRSRMVKVS